MITRHFIDVGARRVHYRRAGSGPMLLMAHQSPRSSAEYAPLMIRWSEHFTCIAPDTPGFGQSDPLPGEPEIDDFGDAMIAFLDALGVDTVAAYGFHSGGIILMNAFKRHPERFTALGCGGYAIWTSAEMALFGESYLPRFEPSAYGEHLTWLWHRILEQSWFFPWFATDDAYRLSGAHADAARVDTVVREMLDSGAAYRAGYGAVLRAVRDIPPPDALTPPVLIAAYDGDPLQSHIDRLGAMPAGWAAIKVATPEELEDAMLAHLLAHPAPPPALLPEANDEGFIRITAGGFDGLIHWRGERGRGLIVHAPGESLDMLDDCKLALDMPGHGISDPWPGAPTTRGPWAAVLAAAATALGAHAVLEQPLPHGNPRALFPELIPDRFGAYLTRAWSIARARVVFDPWYSASAASARAFDPVELSPVRLAVAARSLLRATAARAYMTALGEADGNS
jgi:haloalkane dehalogenase